MKRYEIPIRIVKILVIAFATLLCLLIVVNNISGAYANTINRALNVKTYKVVNVDGDTTDTAYFKSSYSENKIDDDGYPIYTQEGIDRLTNDAEKACIDIEGEGLVLLKNDNNALPLYSGNKVSLFGQGSALFNYSTSGSSAASTSGYADFKMAAESVGLEVNKPLWDFYATGAGKNYRRGANEINEAPWNLINSNASGSFSANGNAAIMVISRNSGEGVDVPATGTDGAEGNYLALSQNELDILKELSILKSSKIFEKLIVVLNTANTIQLDFLNKTEISVDSCLWVGNVGKTGIYAVAQVLTGDIVPSGRLSDTYVIDNFSSPAMASWAQNPNKRFAQRYSNYNNYSLNGTQYNYGVYVEGIYMGYRYYETRYEDAVLGSANVGDYDYSSVVAYPFGHGLSYAQFSYSEFDVTEKDDSYDISVTVNNDSLNFDGKEVVQIYLQKPYVPVSGPEVASVELAGYAKTEIIPHGESRSVSITVSKEQFTSYDVNGSGKGGYVLEKGDYYLSVGKNAHDALNNILAAKVANGVNINSSKLTAAGNAGFTYKWSINSRDEISYAASKETNNLVTNQLDFADINRYQNRGNNAVTYVSRSNWSGTMPKEAVALSLTDAMASDLGIHKELPTITTETMPVYSVNSGMSLIMLRSSDENIIDYNNSAWDTFLDQMTYEEQSALLSNAAFGTMALKMPFNKPSTKDNDGPTGVVNSKTRTSFPSEGIWASSFNNGLIKKISEIFAEDALYNGFQSLYATGINLHRTPFGGRAHEYFSEDPFLTGSAVCAEVEGMQSKGVIPTLKHFAFNDEEDQRGGICIWLNEQSAREIYLKPFEMAMRPSKGNAHAIMTSFNRAGCIWTSASSELMINIARKEWNFDGYSITDMAESFKYYMTYDDGIMNGTDLYLAAGDEYALSDYAYSIPFRLRMRDACHRVLYTIANYSAAMNGLSASSKIVPITPWWQVTVYAAIGVVAALTVLSMGAWVADYVLKARNADKKEKKNEN